MHTVRERMGVRNTTRGYTVGLTAVMVCREAYVVCRIFKKKNLLDSLMSFLQLIL